MSYPTHTKAIVCYIEAHIRDSKINHDELESRIGFSLAHIRDFFQQDTGYSLAKYIRMRKVKCSAIELVNTNKTILDIAYTYGFSNPETYTRAFKKMTGMTPSEFREQELVVGKEELVTGVYGIGILNQKEHRSSIRYKNEVYKNDGSTILYGVPRVAHGVYGGSTPYPICLKACSEYLGEKLNYYFTMVSSGAAFRLVWNNEIWDLSNVDIFHTFNETNDVYRLGAKAIGRDFSFLGRDKNTTKEEFMSFIKKNIDKGYPCIALGVIGPPEPCIITGYRNSGEELLGWNFFQDDPEFARSIKIDESGYFVCGDWWNNSDTQAVMCMGAISGEMYTTEEIITNAIEALDGRIDCGYSKGVTAYEAWKSALANEKDFLVGDNYTCLFEKMLCQIDAMSCLIDGRSCAAAFFNGQAKCVSDRTDYDIIAKCFTKCANAIKEMWSLYGEISDMDGMMKNLADYEVRKKSCELIEVAAKADIEALDTMRRLLYNGKFD